MNYLIRSSLFKKGLQIALSLILGVALLGSNAAYAWGPCVDPTGAGHCFTSIQAAVDAANDDDQIIIRPGTYVEQVTIAGKNLSLIGRRGAIVRAPESMEDTLTPIIGYEGRPIILVAEAQVTLRDLVIDGANSAANNPFLYGIFFIDSGGVIRGNVVKNIGFDTPTVVYDNDGNALYQGEGIVVVNFGETPRAVTVAENYVANYNSSGITIWAETIPDDPTPTSLTAQVVNNTVVGSGLNDAIGQWGIFFGAYGPEGFVAEMTGTLKNNRIHDLMTVNQYPSPGVGIATKDTSNTEFSGNVIENVDIGLNVSGTNTQIIGNRFKKASNGILLLVDFPGYGNPLGTTLEDNRFDNVYADLMTTAPGIFEAAAKTMSEGAPQPAQPKRLPR